MKKVLLVCANGMSSGMLVKKMQKYAEEQKFAVDISAVSIANAPATIGNADVVLLGPQIRYNRARIVQMNPNVPVEAIDMTAYGLMDGKKILDRALELIEEK